jgi:basic amino acid/polyamine antiporter, APA family
MTATVAVSPLSPESPLRRVLGVWAVTAVVVGDMLGSGIFFTPGELAAVANAPWQVYILWALAGGITLCGALTLAELAGGLPRAGAPYHIIREGFGSFWAFVLVWVQIWVAGPGSIAGVAIVFGEFLTRFGSAFERWSPQAWGAAAIAFFVGINLLGVRWGGRTQILLTAAKVAGLLGLVGGSLLFADAVSPIRSAAEPASAVGDGGGLLAFVRFVGLGIGAVLFTYDGWIDVSYLGAEIERPQRNLPLGLACGVAGITLLYLVVNFAYLRVVPLDTMRAAPAAVATEVSRAAFGARGAVWLNMMIMISIFGALGGLVMTLPRLFFTAAAQCVADAGASSAFSFFRFLSAVSARTAVPWGSLVFAGASAAVALLVFGTFSRLVNFFVVPLQLTNVLMVLAVFRSRRRQPAGATFRAPGYPIVPLVYIIVIVGFLASAIMFRPFETLIGTALTATAVPAYVWTQRRTW